MSPDGEWFAPLVQLSTLEMEPTLTLAPLMIRSLLTDATLYVTSMLSTARRSYCRTIAYPESMFR